MTAPTLAPLVAAPVFSVLIARVSTADGGRILETLASLQAQDDPTPREVIVVDRLDDDVSASIRARFPDVILTVAGAGIALPEMRARALALARGRFIVVTEDHCVAPRSWLREFGAALARHPDAAVIGGCVENGLTARAFDWATFLCEYAAVAPPFAEGPCPSPAGMNTLYRRRVLDECAPEVLTGGFWETTLHPRLRERGELLLESDRIRIVHCKRFSFRLFAAQRYAYSRHFAGTRFSQQQRLARWIAAAATPALPLVLVVRLLGVARRKAALAQPALRAFPFLLVFFVIWAWGEAVGYVRGPGAALRAIE